MPANCQSLNYIFGIMPYVFLLLLCIYAKIILLHCVWGEKQIGFGLCTPSPLTHERKNRGSKTKSPEIKRFREILFLLISFMLELCAVSGEISGSIHYGSQGDNRRGFTAEYAFTH